MKWVGSAAFLGIIALAGIVFTGSSQFSSVTQGADASAEITGYKSWTKVSKADEKSESGTFRVTDSAVAG
jgi:hypothetical protein